VAVQSSSSITGNGAAYGNEVDNVGVLNLDNTSTIGSVDSVAAWLSPV
jgi:hypothetical protein